MHTLKKIVMGVSVAAALCACAGRQVEPVTVHVFSNQPEHGMVAEISADLDAGGFGHRINYRETPGGLEVGETVLVHPDDATGFNHGQQVAAIVTRHLGREPAIKSTAHGNHNFTRGNLGLYIYLPGAGTVDDGEEVAEIYAGSCGEHSLTLTLMASGGFSLVLERWDAEELRHQPVATRQGEWSDHDDGLRLETIDGEIWTGRLQPGYRDRPLLILDGPAEARQCRLQQPL